MLCDEIHTINMSDNILHEDFIRTNALNKIL